MIINSEFCSSGVYKTPSAKVVNLQVASRIMQQSGQTSNYNEENFDWGSIGFSED